MVMSSSAESSRRTRSNTTYFGSSNKNMPPLTPLSPPLPSPSSSRSAPSSPVMSSSSALSSSAPGRSFLNTSLDSMFNVDQATSPKLTITASPPSSKPFLNPRMSLPPSAFAQATPFTLAATPFTQPTLKSPPTKSRGFVQVVTDFLRSPKRDSSKPVVSSPAPSPYLNLQTNTQTAVFGVMLGIAVQRSNYVHALLPDVIYKCFSYLITKAPREEGIFRITGSVADIKKIRDVFDSGKSYDLDTCLNPHTVAGLLKLFIRELPQSLFPSSWAWSESRPVEELHDLVSSLEPPNRCFLSCLIKMLRVISQASDVTKMGTPNLVIVFGAALQCTGTILTHMINYAPQLFPTDELVQNRQWNASAAKISEEGKEGQKEKEREKEGLNDIGKHREQEKGREKERLIGNDEEDVDMSIDAEREQLLSEKEKFVRKEKQRLMEEKEKRDNNEELAVTETEELIDKGKEREKQKDKNKGMEKEKEKDKEKGKSMGKGKEKKKEKEKEKDKNKEKQKKKDKDKDKQMEKDKDREKYNRKSPQELMEGEDSEKHIGEQNDGLLEKERKESITASKELVRADLVNEKREKESKDESKIAKDRTKGRRKDRPDTLKEVASASLLAQELQDEEEEEEGERVGKEESEQRVEETSVQEEAEDKDKEDNMRDRRSDMEDRHYLLSRKESVALFISKLRGKDRDKDREKEKEREKEKDKGKEKDKDKDKEKEKAKAKEIEEERQKEKEVENKRQAENKQPSEKIEEIEKSEKIEIEVISEIEEEDIFKEEEESPFSTLIGVKKGSEIPAKKRDKRRKKRQQTIFDSDDESNDDVV